MFRRTGILLSCFAVALAVLPPAPALALSTNAVSLTLSWNASSSLGIVGYNVYYSSASRDYTNEASPGDGLTWTVPGLIIGDTYYFAVTAEDALGFESDYSDELVYTAVLLLPPTTNILSFFVLSGTNPVTLLSLTNISQDGAGFIRAVESNNVICLQTSTNQLDSWQTLTNLTKVSGWNRQLYWSLRPPP
jgi:hypothetical protein